MSRIGLVVIYALALSACSAMEPSASPGSTTVPSAASAVLASSTAEVGRAAATPGPTAEAITTLLAVGDIAGCNVGGDEATAALVKDLKGTIATLGDHVYPDGTDVTFADCYHPAWGSFRERTRPAIGNHDLSGDGGAAYFRYFDGRAGTPGKGWYSYDVGDWHAVVLNSNCEFIACGAGSPQHEWLVDDLAASQERCALAYMHHPRFASGPHGGYQPVAPLWEALHAADVDISLAGHDHLYERFAPQGPSGEADPNGVRQFVVGTGGYQLYPAAEVAPNSEVLIDDAFGVLELSLHPDSYEWRFLGVDGTVLDAGSGSCH